MPDSLFKDPSFAIISKKNSEYAECNRNKALKYAFYEQLKSLKTLIRFWKLIVFNFIIKLSSFKKLIIKIKYDSILIIICKFTKYKYFIPYQEASTAEDLTYVFFKNIHNYHKLLKKIISDKNKFFTSKFENYW